MDNVGNWYESCLSCAHYVQMGDVRNVASNQTQREYTL